MRDRTSHLHLFGSSSIAAMRHLLFIFFVLLLDMPTFAQSPDAYAERPFAPDYATRRRAYLDMHAEDHGGLHAQLVRLYFGLPIDESQIDEALHALDTRIDCADFRLSGIVRLLYQFGDCPQISDALRARIRASVLNFKYWPDEPGRDNMCTWTENHYILFSSGDYLMGQYYPDQIFRNSVKTGREKMQIARPRILHWLDLRYKTGFSEWLSNVYYEETMTGLLNLVDFCNDREIADKATMVLDLMLADIALNQFHGTLGSTHGRSYFRHKIDGGRENTGSITKLLFGMNRFRTGTMAAVALALSPNYRMPAVLYDIATDQNNPEFENRQRVSIRIEDAKRWNLDPTRIEDGMLFLTYGAYTHPQTINLFARMLDQYDWWYNSFFKPFKSQKWLIETLKTCHALPVFARLFERDITRNLRTEANLYTYRTPDYMLSTAQDYRKGYGGDQHHIWQATLSPRAVCFTTHPASRTVGGATPNYWTGSGTLPRVAQLKNVVIALYDVSTLPGLALAHPLPFTHAWLPKSEFDAVVERDGWIFARKNDAYLALWSSRPSHWQTEGEWKNRELIAPGKQCVWLCELGRKATDGPFETFIDRICSADLRAQSLHITYHSPSQGRLDFDWNSPLKQNGHPVQITDYPRYQNPYMTVSYPADKVTIRDKNQWLELDYDTLERSASAFVAPEN